MVKLFIKYTIFDCFTTNQNIGSLMAILEKRLFHIYVLFNSLNIIIAHISANMTYIPFELTLQLFVQSLSLVVHLKNLTGVLIFSQPIHLLNSYSENSHLSFSL